MGHPAEWEMYAKQIPCGDDKKKSKSKGCGD
jgi:hypothetical protein